MLTHTRAQQVVEQTYDVLAPEAMGKGIELCAYIDPSVDTYVNGDSETLRQVRGLLH